MNRVLACIVSLICILPAQAQAQDDGWTYTLTTYLWATNTGIAATSPSGHTFEAELDFADALRDLDFALMGSFEARKGQWGLLVDGMNFKLSPSNDRRGLLADEVHMRTRMTVMTGYATYRARETEKVAVDLLGGLRWAKMDTDVSLVGGLLGGTAFGVDDGWVEPTIGLRLTAQISERWSAALLADYGGFDGDGSTWQAAATLGYALNDRWTLRGGYRHMEFDREINGRDFSLDQSGVLFGASYRF